MVVGEAYRVDLDRTAKVAFDPAKPATWGQGGKAPLLIDPCTEGPTHSLIFAGSGGFKTVSAATTLAHWTGAAVVLNPSRELGPMLTAAWQAMGHKVVALEPGTPVGVNVLDWIDVAHPLAESNVHAVVGWIVGESDGSSSDTDKFFRNWSKQLIACLLTHMLWDDSAPQEMKTLRSLRTAIATPENEMRALLAVQETKAVFEQRGIGTPAASGEPLPLDEAAEARRRAAVQEFAGAVAPPLADLTNRVLFGDLWRRPALAPRDRSLVTVAALVASGQAEQMPFHVNRAMDAGLTEAQLSEVVTHLAFYAGWPRSMSTVPVVQAILAGRRQLGSEPPAGPGRGASASSEPAIGRPPLPRRATSRALCGWRRVSRQRARRASAAVLSPSSPARARPGTPTRSARR